jgi:hypothetical protein
MNTITNVVSETWNVLSSSLFSNVGVGIIWTIVDAANYAVVVPIVNGITQPLGSIGGYLAQVSQNTIGAAKVDIAVAKRSIL